MRDCRRGRGRPANPGFTLVEAVVVVAIVGIVAASAGSILSTVRQRATAERALYTLRARVDRARSLAAVAGSRLNTPRLIASPDCPAGPGNLLWGQWVGSLVTLPDQLNYDAATDVLTANCRAFDVVFETNNRVTGFTPDTVAGLFAFSPSGRLIQNGAAGPLFFAVQNPDDPTPLGFTVLTSGVTCRATLPGECLEDRGQ